MAQWVMDPALPLLWPEFDPWPWNFLTFWVHQKKGSGVLLHHTGNYDQHTGLELNEDSLKKVHIKNKSTFIKN